MGKMFEIEAEGIEFDEGNIRLALVGYGIFKDARVTVREIHPAAGEWQDIKDAPKDGRIVLLCCWRKKPLGGGPIMIAGRWIDKAWHIPGWTGMVEPTHFALVTPPKEADSETTTTP